MAEKKVAVTLSHAPYGSIFYTEGLRAAVGVTAGIDEHTVDVIYIDDGVLYALKDTDRSDSAHYLAALNESGARFLAESGALINRGLDPEALADDIVPTSIEEISAILADADVHMGF